MKPRLRSGFTAFELLLVLAIIGFLLGLLLPFIARVRQTATRTQSINNLKQIALACHGYHDAYRKLPSGNDANNFSAAAYLLPFVEQEALFRKINFQVAMDDKANAFVRQAHIAVFESPQDPQGAVSDKAAPTNYLFNAGSKYALQDNDGVFYQDSKIRLQEIADGTSNTVMAGETLKGDGKAQGADVRRQHVLLAKDALKGLQEESGVAEFKDGKNIASDRCASWLDGRFLQGTFTGTRLLNDARPDVSCDGAGGLSGLRSLHGGANIALCDGSVRHLQGNLTVQTWGFLTSRNDGNTIPNLD